MAKYFNTSLKVTFAVIMASLVLAGSALANTTPREGKGGNNIVCGGVPSKAILMYYTKNGVDACGNRDIAAIWKRQGITPQVASMMHSGTVCSSGGFTSSGRQHGPMPALDHAIMIGGNTVYLRPLAVWGSTCYQAWIGQTEDGHTVAILIGCGNTETSKVPAKSLPSKKHRTSHAKKPPHKATPAACVTTAGAPLYAPLPAGINVLNGVCTAVTNTTTVKSCNGNDVPITDSQGVVINCITNTNVNNNTTTVVTPPVTVIVNPPATPCNCTTPPPAPHATVTNLTPLQDQGGILAGNTYRICADVSTSESMSANFSAHYGAISNASATVVNGTSTICADYTAPNDVQAATDDYHVIVTCKGQVLAHADLTITVQPQPSRP